MLLHSLRSAVQHGPAARNALLICGAAAFPLYIAMDTIAARRYEGYRYADQTISELSAIDAPTRSFWMGPGFVYSGLMLAFGFGVWASAGPRRALRLIGMMAAAVGVVGFVGWPFSPMHKREVLAAGGGTRSDTMHLVCAGVSSVLFIASVGLGIITFGKRFRRYSIVTLLVALVAGALMGQNSPKVATNEPTPWLGIHERIAVFSPMLWYAILAIGLVRAQRTSGSRGIGNAQPIPGGPLQVP